MKKHLTILLLCGMLLSTVVSCGDSSTADTNNPSTGTENSVSTEETGTETETETETELTDALPEGLSFNGNTVAFYTDAYSPIYSPIFVEDYSGDGLNDARYKMEGRIEDRLDVIIEETHHTSGPWSYDYVVDSVILAGDKDYHIFSNMDLYMIAATMNGKYYPTSDVPYVKLDAAYWNPQTTQRFMVGGKVFFTLSSFSLYSYANTSMVMMNMDLAKKHGLNDIYHTVMDGKWTYDLMKEYAELAYEDTNGDGAVDSGDTFGYAMNHPKVAWLNAVVGSNCQDEVMMKDQNNHLIYGVTEHMVDALQMFYQLYHTTPYVWNEPCEELFEIRSLFRESKMSTLNNTRDLEYDIMVLPIPKANEAQAQYFARTYDTYFTMVPVTCVDEDLNLAGAVLEALACESYKSIMPAYLEVTLTEKLSHNEESSNMIRMILESRTISIAEAFLFDFYGDEAVWLNYLMGTNESPASYIESKESAVIAQIEQYNNYFVDEGAEEN